VPVSIYTHLNLCCCYMRRWRATVLGNGPGPRRERSVTLFDTVLPCRSFH
jgi:hypothetical protein